jgi:copper chaperone CopZ
MGRDMQKKIYVAGMFDDDTAKKVDTAVRSVSGVTNVVANAAKAQVLVDFNDGTPENAINDAIKSVGVDVLS